MVGFSIAVPEAKFYAEYLGASELWLMAPRKEPFIITRIKSPSKTLEVCEVMVEFLKSF
jgi:hypothetical protein